jgi:hypothetical protein
MTLIVLRLTVRQLLVQQTVELRPDLVLLRAGDMTKKAHSDLALTLAVGAFGSKMIEVEKPPTASGCIAIRVLDSHIGAIESTGK